jgi:sugar lactone lactonase YvrE
MMGRHPRVSPALKLALVAVVLAACAPPSTVPPLPTATTLPPAAVPTKPATATALPAAVTTIPLTTPAFAGNAAIPASGIMLNQPEGLAFDADGNLYVSQCGDPYIFRIDRAGLLTVYAGTGEPGFSGDGGPARSAQLQCPHGLAFDHDGNLYLPDARSRLNSVVLNNRIRRIDRDGVITTVAGSGADLAPGFAGDGGPATAARLNSPTDVAFDPDGNLYIADAFNNRVRQVNLQGMITTIAGSGGAGGYSGDGGPATAAQLHTSGTGVLTFWMVGLAVDGEGNLYVADSLNYRVRRIDRQGVITTIAGTGQSGYSGDGGPATAAQLSYPTDLAIDVNGNLYISDNPTGVVDSNRVRKVDKNGIITTVAGRGERGYPVDGGPAVLAALNHPSGLAIDSEGNLFIVDAGNNRVRRVDTNGIITTVVGGGP